MDKEKIVEKELIGGRMYERLPIDEKIEKIGKFFNEFISKTIRDRSIEAEVFPPFENITIDKQNTIIRPLLAVKKDSSENQVDWIIDYADNEHDVLAYCVKPMVFLNSGIQEYWIIDIENDIITIYDFKKFGLVQQTIMNPRRFRSNLFNSIIFNYSQIFGK